MRIIIEIPETDETEFLNGFNKAIAKPPQYQHMTDEQFLQQWIIDSIYAAYKTGKIQIARETTKPTIHESLISVKKE